MARVVTETKYATSHTAAHESSAESGVQQWALSLHLHHYQPRAPPPQFTITTTRTSKVVLMVIMVVVQLGLATTRYAVWASL